MKIIDDFKSKSRLLYGTDSIPKVTRALLADASLAMILFRLVEFCYKRQLLKMFGYLLSKVNSICCGAVIGCKATFGKGFVIVHSVGLVINSKVKGGDNIVIEGGVVIGDEKGFSPTLGNNIFIGSGAKIFGNISIGNNVSIGANSVVNKDVPDDVTIGGIPAKIIRCHAK